MPQHNLKYASVTWIDYVKAVCIMSALPFVAGSQLLLSFFSKNNAHKPWRRVLTDATFRYVSSSMSVPQMQLVMGTTLSVYKKWAKQHGVERDVQELGDDARLLWMTERNTDRVILYIHGGVYCLPMQEPAATFWKKTVDSINDETRRQVGLVTLNYSLVPTAYFPTQLKQTILALNHLRSSGIKPENIHIAGESAGGALILQLLSYILHPLSDKFIPSLNFQRGDRFGSFCIMSPWVSLNGKTGSHLANSDSDVLPASTWAYLGDQNRPSLNSSKEASYFMEALNVPDEWFSGTFGVVDRILISVGEKECLRDDVLEVAQKLGNGGQKLRVVVDKNGVHNDQYQDIMAGYSHQRQLTKDIRGWMLEKFIETDDHVSS
ncbi:Alpha/Beta hydrolase protein [Crepidotus variabilis]|uniref:Alpha/Beta hydrolase protein n=1 Tax=Crepidotus variabilis TaxID=179855 RepID=A0A9P6EAK5_9AGAR|nr:Alpha/Beta hydrolase protein [Crepidotus variabilis]